MCSGTCSGVFTQVSVFRVFSISISVEPCHIDISRQCLARLPAPPLLISPAGTCANIGWLDRRSGYWFWSAINGPVTLNRHVSFGAYFT